MNESPSGNSFDEAHPHLADIELVDIDFTPNPLHKKNSSAAVATTIAEDDGPSKERSSSYDRAASFLEEAKRRALSYIISGGKSVSLSFHKEALSDPSNIAHHGVITVIQDAAFVVGVGLLAFLPFMVPLGDPAAGPNSNLIYILLAHPVSHGLGSTMPCMWMASILDVRIRKSQYIRVVTLCSVLQGLMVYTLGSIPIGGGEVLYPVPFTTLLICSPIFLLTLVVFYHHIPLEVRQKEGNRDRIITVAKILVLVIVFLVTFVGFATLLAYVKNSFWQTVVVGVVPFVTTAWKKANKFVLVRQGGLHAEFFLQANIFAEIFSAFATMIMFSRVSNVEAIALIVINEIAIYGYYYYTLSHAMDDVDIGLVRSFFDGTSCDQEEGKTKTTQQDTDEAIEVSKHGKIVHLLGEAAITEFI